MIEVTILNYFLANSEVPTFMEEPTEEHSTYRIIEKTGGGQNDRIYSSTLAIQSYAPTMAEAAALNKETKAIMLAAEALPDVGRIRLNSDYNYTDTTTQKYRYQAVYDIVHY